MFRQTLHPKKILKNAAAALLMLSLSGAYFLLCCQAANAAAGSGAQHHAAPAANQAEHCKFSKHKSSETSTAAAARLSAFECCPLRFRFFVAKLEKNEFPQQTLGAANSFEGFFKSVKLARSTGLTDFSYRAPVRQSRDLHIRNCVFRI